MTKRQSKPSYKLTALLVLCLAFASSQAFTPTPPGKPNHGRTTPTPSFKNNGKSLHVSTSAGFFEPSRRRVAPIPDTTDPYVILNIQRARLSKDDVQRAYHQRAAQYHPDARTHPRSSQAEVIKAHDDFAKINAAYGFLTGTFGAAPAPPVARNNAITANPWTGNTDVPRAFLEQIQFYQSQIEHAEKVKQDILAKYLNTDPRQPYSYDISHLRPDLRKQYLYEISFRDDINVLQRRMMNIDVRLEQSNKRITRIENEVESYTSKGRI